MKQPLLPERHLTPEERAAHNEDPRAGVWAGIGRADLRALTQEETDALIRAELWQEVSRRGLDDIGEAQGVLGVRREVRHLFDGAAIPLRSQRGGIDSDPLVRLLAYRAWGDRDRQWFALRGVRTGDAVARIPDGRGAWALARRWSTDRQEHIVKRACNDAPPGSLAQCTVHRQALGGGGDRLWFRVSDRPRVEPGVTLGEGLTAC